MKNLIINPTLICETKKELTLITSYLKNNEKYYEKCDNYVTIYSTFTFEELKSIIDESRKDINVVSKIIVRWFGIDNIIDNIEDSYENITRYDSIKMLWRKGGVNYEFINCYNIKFVTDDAIEALDWMQRGLTLVRVDGKCQREWEDEYGIEVEY